MWIILNLNDSPNYNCRSMKIPFFVLMFATLLFCSSLPLLSSSDADAIADDPPIVYDTDPTVIATPTPTPTPTHKPTPGSPLIFGSNDLGETISQFNISILATMVMTILGVIWGIVILATVMKKLIEKKLKDAETSE
jgi:hypothetical protein